MVITLQQMRATAARHPKIDLVHSPNLAFSRLSLLREVHEFAAKWVRISFAPLKSAQTAKASGSDASSSVNLDLPEKARRAGYLEL
jgi:hypothetical protein